MVIDNSRYVAFWDSPERFRLKYMLNLVSPEVPYPLQRGLALHVLAEETDKGTTEAAEARLAAEGYGPKAITAAKRLFKEYQRYNQLGAPKVIATECEFIAPIPGSSHKIAGRIDQILQIGADYWVGDLKTAKADKSRADVDFDWKHNSQADFVILGARELGYDVKGLLVRVLVESTPPRIWPIEVHRSQLQLETLLYNVHQTCETIQMFKTAFGIDAPWPHTTKYPCYKEGLCEYESICRKQVSETGGLAKRREHLGIIEGLW